MVKCLFTLGPHSAKVEDKRMSKVYGTPGMSQAELLRMVGVVNVDVAAVVQLVLLDWITRIRCRNTTNSIDWQKPIATVSNRLLSGAAIFLFLNRL